MKKFVLIPDSFKGTMSSAEICDIMAAKIAAHYPGAEVAAIPVADGGEGSVDCFLQAMGGEKKACTVKGPLFENMESFYGLVEEGKTAVVEMAACAGLPLLADRLDPEAATTYGVGQMICEAVGGGANKVIVGLGGSATNDGGCGAAAAAGVRFLGEDGKHFVPTGGTLQNIRRIDVSGVSTRLKQTRIVAMCDIDNPMYGEKGAAYVFGPQKGAGPETVQKLDAGLRHLCGVVKRDLGIDLSELPGGGAAGAMGAGMHAFFGATLQMGIETVLGTVGFDKIAKDATAVLTGEGKIDTQSLRGKVVIGVAKRAKALGVPVLAVVGDVGDEIEEAYDLGVTGIFSINQVAKPFGEVKSRSPQDMAFTVDNLLRTFKALGL